MKLRIVLPTAILAGLVLAFSCQAERVGKAATSGGEMETLHKAYSALYSADHDYHGHRIKAMHAIESAIKALGGNVKGDGKGDEPQATSDEHLKRAQKMLQGLKTTSTGKHQGAAEHVQHALTELSTALSVK